MTRAWPAIVVLALVFAGASVGVVLATRGTARHRSRPALGDRAACTRYDGLGDGGSSGTVFVRGGRFRPGSTHGYRDELPAGEVAVGDFDIDRTEVTNAEFMRFVRATGYVTTAERAGEAPIFDASPNETRDYAWWRLARGASHRHPDADTNARPADNEPVVQVTFADAMAYARWLGRTLPTEAQWEYAARAGRDDASQHRAPRRADGTPLANFFQGAFPAQDTKEDGFDGRAPVGCYPANAYGLYDMIGNVWEWTRDAYHGGHRDAPSTPPTEDETAPAYVIKGGSYLCSRDFCTRYRASARHRQEADMPGVHLGFRTVRAR